MLPGRHQGVRIALPVIVLLTANQCCTPVFAADSGGAGSLASATLPAEPEQEAAREREQSAEEDPLAQQQAERVDRPEKWEEQPDGIKAYGSVRLRYRNQDGDSFWGDGGSRFGVEGRWQLRPAGWLFVRGEAGVNILDELERIFEPGSSSGGAGSSFFKRLLYVGWESPSMLLVAGKNWSPYYRIASFTDRFKGTGGNASGTFNAGTDGGATGTGRADRAVQSRVLAGKRLQRWNIKPFNLGIQFQYGESIPHVEGANYGLGISLSGILEFGNDYTLGVAYNHARIDRKQAGVRRAGIDGDAQALLLGTRWFGERWYLGTTVSRLVNHEATDDQVYFDGWGWEVYGQYQVKGPVWATGGWNYLVPDGGQPGAGRYLVKYGVAGLRYSFDKFSKMLFLNAKFEGSRQADGNGIGNVYTLGVQWDLP